MESAVNSLPQDVSINMTGCTAGCMSFFITALLYHSDCGVSSIDNIQGMCYTAFILFFKN